MKRRWKALLASAVAATVVNLGGVLLFFDRVARADSPAGRIVHPAAGLLVYVVLTVALFDWTARQMRNAYKAAVVVAASQFLLVNVDYVLAGKRGLMTGAASTLLMVITWSSVAAAYSYFIRWENE